VDEQQYLQIERGQAMEPLISDSSTDTRMAGLERFLQRYLGPRLPEYGETEDELRLIEMPDPLQRFFRFAGRWAGQNPKCPYVNRFCMQDHLSAIRKKGYVPTFQIMDGRLVFVWENQAVWVAATERTGADPPVWITEECSHRVARQVWRQMEKPLSHFLVSFVLQELMFGSDSVAIDAGVIPKLEQVGLAAIPVWTNGEYVFEDVRPSYFLVGERFLVRTAPEEADGDDWYGYIDPLGGDVLRSVGLATEIV
jgi:hypothetical protein